MKKVFKYILAVLQFVTISATGNSQNHNPFQTSDAILVHVNENTLIENRVDNVIVALSNYTNLNVRMTIPWHSIDNMPEQDSILKSPGILFKLTMNIDPTQLRDYDSSPKMFTKQGLLTVNGITMPAVVEYEAVPYGIDLNDGLYLSILIQFYPTDFGLDISSHDSKFFVRISNAKVNRI
jgi:hypothetical protein